jgi:hypothetical protein
MIQIEVLPAELQAANFIARNAEILSINLRRSVFQVLKSAEHDTKERDESVELKWKTEPHSSPQAGRLIATAGILVEVKPPRTKKKAEAELINGTAVIELLYEVQYLVPSTPVPKHIADANGIEAFCKWNALYNCWPFFREDVRRICVQAGLPPLTIPLLKLCSKDNSSTHSSKSSEKSEK